MMQKYQNQPRTQNRGSALGISLILVVFILLCLITFGTLSYLQAKANDALSLSSTESTLAYYTADAAAKERLQMVEDVLAACYPYDNDAVYSAEARYWYSQATQAALAWAEEDGVFVGGYIAEDGTEVLTIFYDTPVSDTEALRVSLDVQYPAVDAYYSITGWCLISASEAFYATP